jgi:hypothetical protein
VIHRDIKPANILSDGSHALVTDFGVAKALGASLPLTGVAGHTTSGMAIGTPAYMAPEQLAADPAADHRVDIYAVGLLAYELLSGASPFAAPSPTATMTAQLTRTPDPLATVRPGVPAAFSTLVERCLAKSPDQRPADARAVLSDLDRISGALAADEHRQSREPVPSAPARASMVPLVLGAMAVLVLVAAGLWWNGRRDTRGGLPGVPDTVVVQGGTDTAESRLLASAPLTRDDSLAIAAALRDELERIDPAAARSPASAPAPSTAEVSLERELARADSLVRERLAVISSQAEAMQALVERNISRGNSSIGRATTPDGPRRTILIVAATSRRENEAVRATSQVIAAELRDHFERRSAWEVIAESEGVRSGEVPADVLVTVGATPTGRDSLLARITVRNTAPGSSFGFNVVSSRPMAANAGPDAWRGTVRDAITLVESLRLVERGQEWQMDIGRFRGLERGASSPRDTTPPRPPGIP